ncbi:MAG: IS66 family transposase [Paracoccus sp. (in: a-proteobacteria)]
MEYIQKACDQLAGHWDCQVSRIASEISSADIHRDAEHQNTLVAMEASLSNLSVKLKVEVAHRRRMEAQNRKFRDMLFGPSSEKTDKDDGKSEEPDSDAEIPKPVKPKPKAGGAAETSPEAPKKRGMLGRQKVEIPAHLPREPRIIEPEQGATCGCGFDLRKVGEQIIERLTYEPAKVYVIEEHYPKYSCRCCGKFVQASVPKQAFDYTKFDDSLIAGLLVGKFADFLPNYRQEEILKRSGVKLPRSTMSRLNTQAVDALLPVFDALEADLKSSSKLLMDETVMPQLLPGNGRTKTGYAWALCRDDRRWCGNAPPGVVFNFRQSRSGEHAEEILQGYHGILQVDGYGGYNRLTRADRDGGPLTLAFCWAHVRRKFLDVHKTTKSVKAMEIVTLINEMYQIEARLKGRPAEARLSVRQVETAPRIVHLRQTLEALSGQIAMKSTLGDAIKYTLKLFYGLTVFLTDGRVEIDSNPVENTIRPIAMLRKNALFAGSPLGGRNWAVMASLMATCRMNGVEPYAYLNWVFEQMANGLPRSQYDTLLPWNCPKGRHGIE